MEFVTERKADTESQNRARAITDAVQKEINSKPAGSQVDIKKYTGTYEDKWFGKVTLEEKGGRILFTSARSPKLHGEMQYYTGNTFIVKWFDRSMDADAFIIFSLDRNGIAESAKMKAISPLTDFSFDFHDLSLRRVK